MVIILALFWAAIAALFLGLFLFEAVDFLYSGWLHPHAIYWLLAFVATAPLAAALFLRRPWAQPVVVQYHYWLGSACWLGAFLLRPYGTLLDLPLWGAWDMPTREYSLMTFWVLFGAISLLVAYRLTGTEAGKIYFKLQPLRNDEPLCPDCGSRLQKVENQNPICHFCLQINRKYLYYLFPLPANLSPLELCFEPGHWHIPFGRGVGWAEAQLDEHALLPDGQPAYLSVARHHATFTADKETGALSITREQGYDVRVNGYNARTNHPIWVGDRLTFKYLDDEGVDFVLTSPTNRAFLIELLCLNDQKRDWFSFTSQGRREFTLGRAEDNHIVIPQHHQGISRYHVRFIWEMEGGDLLVENLSTQADSLFVNNVLVSQATPDQPGSGGFVTIPLTEVDAKGFINIDIDQFNYRLYLHTHMLELP